MDNMDNCYLCNVNLPKGEGNIIKCPYRGSFLLYFFLPRYIGSYLESKAYTLQTVCDNCFAANEPQLGNIIFNLVVLALGLIGIISLSVWGYIKVFNGW